MNLVLMNVDETYTVMVRVPHPYTVTIDEPADPQPLEPLYALNPDTGMPTAPMLFLYCITMDWADHAIVRCPISATLAAGAPYDTVVYCIILCCM